MAAANRVGRRQTTINQEEQGDELCKQRIGHFGPQKDRSGIIKPIYQILVREIGKVHAQAVIGEAIENAAIAAGKQFAAQEPNGADLRSFAALQYLWEKTMRCASR